MPRIYKTHLFQFHKYKFTVSHTTIDNVEFNIKLTPRIETKRGKQHVSFSDIKLNFDTTRLVR